MQLIPTQDFVDWFAGIQKQTARFVREDLAVLEKMGRSLHGTAKVKSISSAKGIYELRTKAGGNQVRVFFAYDPNADAVLLLGGFKSEKKLYKGTLEKAQRLFADYLADLKDQDDG